MSKIQEEIEMIKRKVWRVLNSCTKPAPFEWAGSGETHFHDRARAADRFLELAKARINELQALEGAV